MHNGEGTREKTSACSSGQCQMANAGTRCRDPVLETCSNTSACSLPGCVRAWNYFVQHYMRGLVKGQACRFLGRDRDDSDLIALVRCQHVAPTQGAVLNKPCACTIHKGQETYKPPEVQAKKHRRNQSDESLKQGGMSCSTLPAARRLPRQPNGGPMRLAKDGAL